MSGELREINLEDGRPAVSDALKRMKQEIQISKKRGYCAVKLIHGFGSTGKGGKIRIAVRKELSAMQSKGEIGIVVHGEKLTVFDEDTRVLLSQCPDLRRDSDIERCNSGITVVGLKRKAR